MARYLPVLDTKLMIGVGAAFLFHTGAIQDSPRWVKRAGLQWLHRLIQEPSRLWRRYLLNNPRFIFCVLLQLIGAEALHVGVTIRTFAIVQLHRTLTSPGPLVFANRLCGNSISVISYLVSGTQ